MVDIAEVKRQVSPAEVIERYTGARRQRNKYSCPFHADKHPSLSVKVNTWKCWACGEGGDVVDFTKKYFGLTFKEALEKLAVDFNIANDIEPAKGDIWAKVEADCRQKRQQELRQVREDINNQIDTMTIVHRCLFHMGYYKEAERYANELDRLQESLTYWK